MGKLLKGVVFVFIALVMNLSVLATDTSTKQKEQENFIKDLKDEYQYVIKRNASLVNTVLEYIRKRDYYCGYSEDTQAPEKCLYYKKKIKNAYDVQAELLQYKNDIIIELEELGEEIG